MARAFLRHANMLDHHAGPFDRFVTCTLRDIVLQNGGCCARGDTLTHTTQLSNYRFLSPTTTPADCRENGATYQGTVLVDVSVSTLGADGRVISAELLPDVVFCHFPVMVHSGACVLRRGQGSSGLHDYPGSFIINGKRRFIGLMRDLLHNYPLLFVDKAGVNCTLHYRSEHVDRPHRSTSTLEICVSSGHRRGQSTPSCMLVSIPFVSAPVPMGLLVAAMGATHAVFAEQIMSFVGDKCPAHVLIGYIQQLAADVVDYPTRDLAMAALGSICKRDASRLAHMLHLEVLPHLNGGVRDPPATDARKVQHLAHLCGHLILFVAGVIRPTNRDDLKYIRALGASDLLASLFRRLTLAHMRQCAGRLRRLAGDTPVELGQAALDVYRHTRLTRGINSAMATGNWSPQRKGLSQSLNTTNSHLILSQLRRISGAGAAGDGRHVPPRVLLPSAYGYECAAETPEGEQCGIVRALALFTRVSPSLDNAAAESIVLRHQGALLKHDRAIGDYTVFGPSRRILGFCSDIRAWSAEFGRLRESRVLGMFTTEYVDEVTKDWYCFCDGGRLVRPLIVLKNAYKLPDLIGAAHTLPPESLKHALVGAGCVEYVDPLSESNCRVLVHPGDAVGALPSAPPTHMELSDVSFLGVLASTTPLFRHNQGPRLVYWTNMVKQVITTPPCVDPSAQSARAMWYPQRPFTATRTELDLRGSPEQMGVNVVIAFMPLEWNQEDAILVNRSAIDMGMFNTTVTRTYSATCGVASKHEIFQKPPPHAAHRRASDYSTLADNGFPLVGEYIGAGAPVIGKTVESKTHRTTLSVNTRPLANGSRKRKATGQYTTTITDASTMLRHNESGVVTSVSQSTYEGLVTARVKLSDYARPLVGDKFSSRHAQKGTLGHICNPEDMPFSVDTGQPPEICMSPLGLTSRMTMGVLLEAILGKVVCLTGDIEDGTDEQDMHTSFGGRMAVLQATLKEHGFHPSGKERYRDGTTGQLLSATVMTGCMTYVKLNHLVQKKGQARATGRVQMLTRQPLEGVGNNGGLRLGTMEIECITAHAASEVLRERTYTTSDRYTTTACRSCGHISESNPNIDYYYCGACGNGDHVQPLEIGYSTKLMTQELAGMGMKVQMFTGHDQKHDA